MAAMLAVLNKRWLTLGWRALDPADSEPMALAWIEALNQAGVDWRYYGEIYRRAIDMRARQLASGQKADDFSVELFIAIWRAMREEVVAAQAERQLPEPEQERCDRCFGTGVEIIEGRGARRCVHSAA